MTRFLPLAALLVALMPALAVAVECRRLREISPDTELRACPAKQVVELALRGGDPGAVLAEGRKRLDAVLGGGLGQRPLRLTGIAPDWRVGVLLAEDALPPVMPAGVEVRPVPARTVAVLGFRGRWSTVRYAERQQALRRDLQKAGIGIIGSPWLVRYPRVLLPDVLQRSEVQVEIASGRL